MLRSFFPAIFIGPGILNKDPTACLKGARPPPKYIIAQSGNNFNVLAFVVGDNTQCIWWIHQ